MHVPNFKHVSNPIALNGAAHILKVSHALRQLAGSGPL